MAQEISYEGGGDSDFGMSATGWRAQIFTTVDGYSISSCSVKLRKSGGSPTTLTLRIRTTDGVSPPNAEPIQTTNLVSGTADISGLTASFEWITVTFAVPYALSAGTAYAVVCSIDAGTVPWAADTANGYAAGNTANSTNDGAWNHTAGTDLKFRTYSISANDLFAVGDIPVAVALAGDAELLELLAAVGDVVVSVVFAGEAVLTGIAYAFWPEHRSGSYDPTEGNETHLHTLIVVGYDADGNGAIYYG